jgi:hypothetical protein
VESEQGLQPSGAINIDPNNPFIERESVTIDRLANQPRSTVTDYVIDKNGNTLEKREYGWSNTFDGAPIETPGSLLRTTRSTFHLSVPSFTDTANARTAIGTLRLLHAWTPRVELQSAMKSA